MFTLKIPCAVPNDCESSLSEIEGKSRYATLEGAICAAIDDDLDLESAVIEINGVWASVSEWISVRVAGGDLESG